MKVSKRYVLGTIAAEMRLMATMPGHADSGTFIRWANAIMKEFPQEQTQNGFADFFDFNPDEDIDTESFFEDAEDRGWIKSTDTTSSD